MHLPAERHHHAQGPVGAAERDVVGLHAGVPLDRLQLAPVTPVLVLAARRPIELKHRAAGPLICTSVPTLLSTPASTKTAVSPASSGTAWIAQLLPLSTAVRLVCGALLLVSENTVCRLRRIASDCARRRPFCKASLTLRT